MLQSYLEKSVNFILPNLWEPCKCAVCIHSHVIIEVFVLMIRKNVSRNYCTDEARHALC